jgi:hypothetical protein
MIDPILSAAGGDSQSPHETVPFQDSASEGLKPEPDENILRLVKIMSHDLRTSLFSMLATLKLLNRGYYGKMDKLKERWWERWSMVTGRPLRRSQKRP